MARLLFGLGVAAVIFTIYAVADCAFFDRMRIRGLSRAWWIVIIIFVPIIGGVLWFLIGRGRRDRGGVGRNRTVAPDDDAEFLRGLHEDAAQAERIRRMEQELAELDGDEPDVRGTEHERKRPDAPDAPGEAGPSGSGPSGRPNG